MAPYILDKLLGAFNIVERNIYHIELFNLISECLLITFLFEVRLVFGEAFSVSHQQNARDNCQRLRFFGETAFSDTSFILPSALLSLSLSHALVPFVAAFRLNIAQSFCLHKRAEDLCFTAVECPNR